MLAVLHCMSLKLRSPFSSRVFCSGAAPGRHDIIYALVPPDQIQDWRRLCDHKGCYTQLAWDGDPEVLPKSGHQLEKAALLLRSFTWKHVGRPGGYRHIRLEGRLLCGWLSRCGCVIPNELNVGCIHPVDNASMVGAATMGRSAARALNGKMLKIMCCQLLAGLCFFFPWVGTADNPAGLPRG